MCSVAKQSHLCAPLWLGVSVAKHLVYQSYTLPLPRPNGHRPGGPKGSPRDIYVPPYFLLPVKLPTHPLCSSVSLRRCGSSFCSVAKQSNLCAPPWLGAFVAKHPVPHS